MGIIIGADIVPTSSNEKYFENGGIENIIQNELFEIIKKADYRIFNLETPLTNVCTPIKKAGPNLIACEGAIKGIKNIGVDFFTVANNHILDQGEQGLHSTIKLLSQNGIAYAGVGKTIEEASKPYIFNLNGKKIGVYCCVENEFSIVSEQSAGANPFDVLESFDHVRKLKKDSDYVICLYHGGKEQYRYPSPRLQKVCRKFVDNGVDLVVCQHSHCIGCEERWGSGLIVYGQGNFIFDGHNNDFWNTSLLLDVDFENKKVNYIPIQKDGYRVKLADEKEVIMQGFFTRSQEILKMGFVKEQYDKLAQEIKAYYVSAINPFVNSFFYKVFNKISGGKFGKRYIKKYLYEHGNAIQNLMKCETHSELFLAGLEKNDE